MSLLAEGHECRVAVSDPAAQDTLQGFVPRTPDFRDELAWIRAAGDEGVILFEGTNQGRVQDELRAAGYQVIGGSALGDRLENERELGQQMMAEAGMQVAPVHHHADLRGALEQVRQTRKRYVLKPCGEGYASYRTYVGMADDGEDMLAYLEHQVRMREGRASPPFVLMEHRAGVEVGVGAYFDGRGFLEPACLDWEHKRFFPGDLGELTGEMGTLVSYRGAEKLFRATLLRMSEPLARSGYVGYINLNTIVNEQGVWPLELTCRFGYPGFAILSALHASGWSELFTRMLRREQLPRSFATHDGYAVGVVLTVPPFPYAHGYQETSKGLTVCLSAALSDEDRRHLHFGELALQDGRIVTAGQVGYLMVVTGRGATVREARDAAYARVNKVYVPNLRYRNDIGERFMREDHARLSALGWL
jgi:phosphoribosylamine--glycine ligase